MAEANRDSRRDPFGDDDFGDDRGDRGDGDDFNSAPAQAPAPTPEPAAPSMASSARERASDISEQVSDRMNSASSSLKSMFSNFDGKRALTILLTTLAVILVAGGVVLVLWWIMKRGAIKTTSHLLVDSKVPLSGTEYKKLSGGAIPRAFNGKRMTMSFWIYIHDLDRYKGTYRHIWHRGDKDVQGASPLVFLDRNSNKLHVRFEKINKITSDLSMVKPYDATFKEKRMKVTTSTLFTGKIDDAAIANHMDLVDHGITIDYIPLQRWVHVSVVVNEEVNGGIIYAYVDGELVKQLVSGSVVAHDAVPIKGKFAGAGELETTIYTKHAKKRAYMDLNLDKVGDIYTGGSALESVGPGFSGLVAGISFYNHDLSAKEVYEVYARGPVDNMAAKLGLPAYGVRSPVYRI
jgi:hypothetical protein